MQDANVQERKPSSISTISDDPRGDKSSKEKVIGGAGNWSCNAGDSGKAPWDHGQEKPKVQEQNWSSNAKDSIVPQKEPCPMMQECDFDFKIMPPTGL